MNPQKQSSLIPSSVQIISHFKKVSPVLRFPSEILAYMMFGY